ncbi:MAG: GFA family protein [Betaproteobacteria bacterium]|nr:GFA family protein [Betaproteobacteria bacterium]
MLLKGSCHCGAVGFSVESRTPYPYMRCYCSICRKTQGGGGFAINIMGESNTLRVRGKHHLAVYRARIQEGPKVVRSPGRRYFCKKCGSCLWVHDPRWGQWVYPFASAIDTPLPRSREIQHILLHYAPTWVEVPKRKRDRYFREFPREAIIDWHRRRGLLE